MNEKMMPFKSCGILLFTLLCCQTVATNFVGSQRCDEPNGTHEDLHIDINAVAVDWPFHDTQFTTRTIVDIISTIKITLLCIFSDKIADPVVNAFLLRLNDPSIRVMHYRVDNITLDGSNTIMESYVSEMKLRTEETFTLVLCGDPLKMLWTFRRLGICLDKTSQTGIEHSTRWLTVSPKRYLDELEKELVRLDNVAVIAPVLWEYQPTMCPTLGVYTMHIDRSISDRCLEAVGLTSEDCQLDLNGTLYPNADGGFNGRHFTIGLYVWDPFTMRINKGNSVSYEGFCVDLVQELSVRLNFNYTLTEPADNNWGSPLPDGNWTGVVGMLQRHEIDVSVAAMIITEGRETVMDGTFPYYYDHVGVLYKRLNPEDSMWKTYFHPFKSEVFMFFGVSILVSSIVYLLLGVLSPSKIRIDYGRQVSHLGHIAHAASEVDNVVSAVFQQGRPDMPSHCSGQVFLSFWWMFLIIMAAIYKGNLIAFFMVPQEEVPFVTLYDLATQDLYKWGVTGSTVVEYLFQESERPDFKLLGDGIEKFKASDKSTNSLDPQVHLAKVKRGFYAYISDMVPMEIWMSQDCDLRLLEQTVIPLPFVVGLHNNSGFLSRFNAQLLDIDQMGLYSVWKQRWWPELGACGQESRTAKKVLSVQEVQSSFYILCLGIVLGLLSLLLEYFIKTNVFMGITSSVHGFYGKIKRMFTICRR